MEEITPEDSVAPVYVDNAPLAPIVGEPPNLEELLADQTALKKSAIYKLMHRQALTEAEAEVLVGL